MFRDGSLPARAGIFRSVRRSCNGLGVGTPRRPRGLPRAAEKLGELGDPGSQPPAIWKESRCFLFVADPPQGCQHVGERRFFLPGIPGTGWKTKRSVTRPVEPDHHHAGEDQRHRRRPFHRLGEPIGGILQPQELFAIFCLSRISGRASDVQVNWVVARPCRRPG
jgi:hypothetical protein